MAHRYLSAVVASALLIAGCGSSNTPTGAQGGRSGVCASPAPPGYDSLCDNSGAGAVGGQLTFPGSGAYAEFRTFCLPPESAATTVTYVLVRGVSASGAPGAFIHDPETFLTVSPATIGKIELFAKPRAGDKFQFFGRTKQKSGAVCFASVSYPVAPPSPNPAPTPSPIPGPGPTPAPPNPPKTCAYNGVSYSPGAHRRWCVQQSLGFCHTWHCSTCQSDGGWGTEQWCAK